MKAKAKANKVNINNIEAKVYKCHKCLGCNALETKTFRAIANCEGYRSDNSEGANSRKDIHSDTETDNIPSVNS
jgi:hypothetical protein